MAHLDFWMPITLSLFAIILIIKDAIPLETNPLLPYGISMHWQPALAHY